MMIVVDIHQQAAALELAKEAAKHFAANPANYTYAKDNPRQGELLAIRWNRYTVLVVRIDDTFVPSLYPTNAMGIPELPPIKPTQF